MKAKILLNLSIVLASSLAAGVCDYANSPACPEKTASCGIFDSCSGIYNLPPLCHATMDACCQCIRGFWARDRPNNGGSYSGPDQDFSYPAKPVKGICSAEPQGQCNIIQDQ